MFTIVFVKAGSHLLLSALLLSIFAVFAINGGARFDSTFSKVTILLAILVAASIWVGWILLKGRLVAAKESNAEARRLLSHWRQKLKGKFDLLPDLVSRATVILRGGENFTGQTAQLTETLTYKADELHLAAAGTMRMMNSAERLVLPTSWIAKIKNRFSPARSREAVRLLNSRSIGFDEPGEAAVLLSADSRIPPVLFDQEAAFDPFRISLNQVVTGYQKTEQAALAVLDKLEDSMSGLPNSFNQTGAALEEISRVLDDLAGESQSDGLFPLIELQDSLIPFIEARLEEAAALAEIDPVAAMSRPAQEAARLARDAARICETASTARNEFLPPLKEAADSFRKHSVEAAWMESEYLRHSKELEKLSREAAHRSVSKDLDRFDQELRTSSQRIAKASSLLNRLEKRTRPAISAMESRIDSVRSHLGERIGIDSHRILREDKLDPSLRIDKARRALCSTTDALGRGNIVIAEAESREIQQLLAEAEDLLGVSRRVIRHGDQTWGKIDKERERLKGQLPKTQRILTEMKKRYSPRVLRFDERFGIPLKDSQSIAQNVRDAAGQIRSVDRLLDLTRDSFRRGNILTTGRQLEQAAARASAAARRIEQVEEHHRALQLSEASNREHHADLRWKLRAAAGRIESRETRRNTLAKYEETAGKLDCLDLVLSGESSNPFYIANQLREVSAIIDEIEECAALDLKLHSLSTQQIQNAGQTLRTNLEIFEEEKTADSKHERRLNRSIEKTERLKHQLEIWREFLELEHADWGESFLAGVQIECQAVLVRAKVKGEIKYCRETCRELEKAARATTDLRDWENPHLVAIDRFVADSLFEEARCALAEGRYREARIAAAAARQRAVAALHQAEAKSKRFCASIENEKRSRAAAASRIQSEERCDVMGNFRLTSKLTCPTIALYGQPFFSSRK